MRTAIQRVKFGALSATKFNSLRGKSHLRFDLETDPTSLTNHVMQYYMHLLFDFKDKISDSQILPSPTIALYHQ